MSEQVTMENPEIKAIFEQILKDAETCKKRQQLSEQSFKIWLIDITTRVANRLGYHIQNIAVFINDMNYSIKKGFNAGRDEAKKRSIQYINEGVD